MKGLLGKKIGMSQIFMKNGQVVPVTLVEAGPCYVTQIKNGETDGYTAVQMGFGGVKEKRLNKPELGHLNKAGAPSVRFLAEIRMDQTGDVNVGQTLSVGVFEPGDIVDVTGIAKGKGFQGVIKRWGFHRRPMTHGHHYHRAPGSIGMAASPSRVLKGKKMPGRMGGGQKTVSSLEVVRIEEKSNLIAIKGNIPGPKGGYVIIKEAKKSQAR
jgi:large subunit ribosomal protein L3